MRTLFIFFTILLTGCVNIDKLVTRINEPGAAWSIERKTPSGYIKVSRINPLLGVSQSVTEHGLTATMPTNLTLGLTQQVPFPVPVPPLPSTPTNQTKAKP